MTIEVVQRTGETKGDSHWRGKLILGRAGDCVSPMHPARATIIGEVREKLARDSGFDESDVEAFVAERKKFYDQVMACGAQAAREERKCSALKQAFN